VAIPLIATELVIASDCDEADFAQSQAEQQTPWIANNSRSD
jgi:hypothetical protein